MILAFFSFLYSALRKAADIFSGLPSRIAVLVAGVSAVVAECVSFLDSIVTFFSDKMEALDIYFLQLSGFIDNRGIFSLFAYSLALDELVTILADVTSFIVLVLTFVFVSFVHVVLIFFGLRYGYQCYKYLVKSFSNGLAHA